MCVWQSDSHPSRQTRLTDRQTVTYISVSDGQIRWTDRSDRSRSDRQTWQTDSQPRQTNSWGGPNQISEGGVVRQTVQYRFREGGSWTDSFPARQTRGGGSQTDSSDRHSEGGVVWWSFPCPDFWGGDRYSMRLRQFEGGGSHLIEFSDPILYFISVTKLFLLPADVQISRAPMEGVQQFWGQSLSGSFNWGVFAP